MSTQKFDGFFFLLMVPLISGSRCIFTFILLQNKILNEFVMMSVLCVCVAGGFIYWCIYTTHTFMHLAFLFPFLYTEKYANGYKRSQASINKMLVLYFSAHFNQQASGSRLAYCIKFVFLFVNIFFESVRWRYYTR